MKTSNKTNSSIWAPPAKSRAASCSVSLKNRRACPIIATEFALNTGEPAMAEAVQDVHSDVIDLGAVNEVTLGIPKVPFEESTGQMDHRD